MLILFGCVSDESSNDKYDRFLAEEEGFYALYVVANLSENQISFEMLHENGVNNVRSFYSFGSPESGSLEEIEEIPAYVVFDENDKVFETNDREELFDFLREN